MTDLSLSITGLLDHYCPETSKGLGQPQTPFPKVVAPSIIISKDIANHFRPSAQLLVWDVYVPDLDRRSVEPCKPDFYVDACECKKFLVPTACMRKDCPNCAPFVQNRTAHSIFRRFMSQQKMVKGHVVNPTICYTVLTIPPHMRDRFINPKEIKKVRQKAWEMLRTSFGAWFGVESTHPIGDKSPMFHPHLNFLWMVRDGFTPFIDVSLLQRLWAEILDVLVVDVWHQYSALSAQIFKWCEYVGRPFPGYSWWKGSIRWYGKYPLVTVKKERLCPDCGAVIRRIGIIKAVDVSDFYAHGWLMGLDPPWYNNKNLIPCRGRKKHGRDERGDPDDERGVFRNEAGKLSAQTCFGID